MFGLVWIDDRQHRHAGSERFATHKAARQAKRVLLHDRRVSSVRVVEYGGAAYRPGRPWPPERPDQ
jgi:hypothetical protein